MPTTYNHNGRHSAGEETHRLVQRIFELRRDNVSFPQIGVIIAEQDNRPTPYTQGYIYKLYKRALKQIIYEDVDAVRKIELARLDEMQNYVNNILKSFTPMVNRGMVVRDFLESENGQPILDEEGNPIPVKIEDVSVKLNAINVAMKVMERRARILGLDAPMKVAATDPTGAKEAIPAAIQQLTREQLLEEAQRRGLPTTIFSQG